MSQKIMMEELNKYLSTILSFTDVVLQKIRNLFFEEQLKKNDYVAVEGEYSTKLIFLVKEVTLTFLVVFRIDLFGGKTNSLLF